MKKTLLLLASAAMLLVGCQKEKLGPDAGSGEMVTATYTAQMQYAPQTKAVTDGGGTNANRCVMEIYYQGVLYTRDVQRISNMKATFTPRLVSNRTYDVLFWADCGEDEDLADKYYKTDADGLGLQAVEMMSTSYGANDDARDAFFINESVPVLQQVSSKTFTLKRPFAQVNIITTDAAIIKNDNLYPDGVKMVYTAPTKFNLLSGELSEAKVLTVTGAPYETFNASSAALTLEMDYLFAGLEKSALDIAFEASKTGESTVTSHSFTNIPVQRNYRTNIKGALLTTTGDWTATILPGWNSPDEEVKFVEAGSVAAANEAFANGATSVKITSVGEETTLYLPQTTNEVTIDFTNPSDVITVQYGPAPTKAAGDKPAAVNIATNDVTKFTVTGISNIVWLAGNQAALTNALANAQSNHTVALANDITMSGQWTPATTNGYTVDGRNHVISNMTITDCGKDYAGLISFMSGGVVKNITVKDANIVYNFGAGKKARGGAIVGISYGGTIENCHAENVSIKGYQKMGGIVGYLAQSGNGFVVRNCSAKNISFTNNTTDLTYQAGGIVGYTLNYNGDILVEGCSVSDITINNQYDGSEGANLPYYCGMFIGSLDNQAAKEGLKIELKNNTISGTNTPQIDQMYANTYFGWANNNEYTLKSQPYFATILIDGQEWTPDYPVKNVTKGTSYPTLAKAVEAASAGDEITLENGEYTLPGLSNITIEGIGDNVVVNHSSGSICATSNATIKNVVFNLGQDGYHGFQHASNLVLDGCTFNGFQTTYGSTTYKNCTFNQDTYAYNMNAYGAEIVCDNCVFNGKGKAVYVYNEGNDNMYHISFNKCVFNEEVGAGTKCKAAILVKENVNDQKYVVNINNCIANFDKYVPDDPDLTGSSLWNMELKDGVTGTDVTVNLNNEKVYPFTSFKVNDVAGLRNAIKMFNKGKEQVEYSIELADGTYEVSDMVIAQNVSGKSLTIKAATAKGVTLKIPATPLYPYMFMVNGCSSYDETRAITFNGFKFDVSAITDKSVAPVMNMTSKVDYSNLGYPKASTGHANDYGGYITIDNCELIGGNGSRNDNAVMYIAESGASPKNITVKNSTLSYAGYLLATYVDGFTAENVKTATPVRHFINNQTSGITVKNCVVDCNTDYAIRANAGPVSITGSKFVMTYNGSDKGGIYVDRGNNTQLTMTGNTYPASYAGANMHDVYNEKGGPCIISNGSQEVNTLENGETYDFPRN